MRLAFLLFALAASTLAIGCGSSSGTGDNGADGSGTGGESSGNGGDSSTSCADCSNGCCDGDTCIPFATQSASQCGESGAACGSCKVGEKCSSTGACLVDFDVCSPWTCPGCCDGNSCLYGTSTSSDKCGADGAACTACADGQVCSDLGTCAQPDPIAADSLWHIEVNAAEAFATNTTGDWDIDASAPEIIVCLYINDVDQNDCTTTVQDDSYTTTFGGGEALTTVVTGQQLIDGVVSLIMKDGDVGADDVGGGFYLTPTTAPVSDVKLDQKSTDTTTGVKSITYSLY